MSKDTNMRYRLITPHTFRSIGKMTAKQARERVERVAAASPMAKRRGYTIDVVQNAPNDWTARVLNSRGRVMTGCRVMPEHTARRRNC